MSVDPNETASFADLVRKMNAIEEGRSVEPKTNHIQEGMKANSMNAILESMYRDKPFESAKALPADYEMPDVSPVLGSDKQKNPYGDYFVGGESKDIDILDVGEYDQEGEMTKGQLNAAADAALELEGILADSDNLPEWVQAKVTKALDYLDTARDYMKGEYSEGANPGDEETWDGVSSSTSQIASTNSQGYEGPVDPEGEKDPTQLTKISNEDSIGKKRSIMDYLSDVENKAASEDVVKEPVKSYKANGKKINIYGNEDDGYRVKINNKDSKGSFGKLDDAITAVETFLERLEERAQEQHDYAIES